MWLNLLRDDCHFCFITKLMKKRTCEMHFGFSHEKSCDVKTHERFMKKCKIHHLVCKLWVGLGQSNCVNIIIHT